MFKLYILKSVALILFVINSIQANTLLVNADCTLADAIIAANTDQIVSGCSAGSGADEIIFENIDEQINVDQGVFTSQLGGLSLVAFPTITTNVSIDGKGLHIMADSSINQFRIFDVIHPGRLTLKNTTVSGARDIDGFGSAIFSLAGELNIFNCQFINNFIAINIVEGQKSLIEKSVFKDNISSTKMLRSPALHIEATEFDIIDSSFIDNRVNDVGLNRGENLHTQGGGIGIWYLLGRVKVINSTISGNVSIVGGGVTFTERDFSRNPLRSIGGFTGLEIINSTITNNTADFGGGVFLFDSTHMIKIKNSIIAGNHSSNELGRELFSEENLNLELNHSNLIADHEMTTAIEKSIGVNDIISNAVIEDIINPLLTINGLIIHTLTASSPAIDAVTSNCGVLTDQIGNKRPADGNGNGESVCDIGSIEANGLSDFIFTSGFE